MDKNRENTDKYIKKTEGEILADTMRFYLKYPNISGNSQVYSRMLEWNLTPDEKAEIELTNENPYVEELLKKENVTRKELLKAELSNSVYVHANMLSLPDYETSDSGGSTFEEEKSRLLEGIQREVAETAAEALSEGKKIEQAIGETKDTFDKKTEALYNLYDEYGVDTEETASSEEYVEYVYEAEEGACPECASKSGVYTAEEIESGELTPEIHPNCRCVLYGVDESGATTDLTVMRYSQAETRYKGEVDTDDVLDTLQTIMDLAGLVPGAGEVADGINAVISLLRGKYADALLSASSMIPIAGMLSTAGKWLKAALSNGDEAADIAKALSKLDDGTEALSKAAKSGQTSSENVDELLEAVQEVERRLDNVAEVAGKTTKTLPTNAPNPSAIPKGTKTKIRLNDEPETIRGLTRENESAEILAKKGYDIEQNPKVNGEKKPDYRIEQNIFDNYSPNANTKPRAISTAIQDKIQSGQTERVVLNLSDWQGNTDDLAKQFKDWPVEGLKEVLVIDKNGNVYHLVP